MTNSPATTRFKGRIVHGMLTASYFSTALAILPGPGTIYLAQSLHFRAPVRIGDTVEARVTVSEIVARQGPRLLKTECRVGDTVVVDGEAIALVPQARLSRSASRYPEAVRRSILPALEGRHRGSCAFFATPRLPVATAARFLPSAISTASISATRR